MSRAYSLFYLTSVAQKHFGSIEVQTRTLKVRQIICKVQVVGYILIINTKIKQFNGKTVSTARRVSKTLWKSNSDYRFFNLVFWCSKIWDLLIPKIKIHALITVLKLERYFDMITFISRSYLLPFFIFNKFIQMPFTISLILTIKSNHFITF